MKTSAPNPPNTSAARNKCLDFLKGIAAICVVFVHVSFPGYFGKCISAVGSCGVMLFFLISGFHVYGDSDTIRPKLLKRFRRNLIVTVIAVLVYFVISLLLHKYAYHDLKSWIRVFAKPRLYLRMFFLSNLEEIGGDVLWFMFALLYAYLFFWLMYRLRLQRFAKFAMPLFILLRIVLETYKYAVNGDWRICSNVLVAAIPLMLLGYCIAEQREKLEKIPAWASAVCCILSLTCLFLLIVYHPFRYNFTQIPKLTTVASAFLFAMKKPHLRIFPPIAALGNAYSLHVYLWHMPIVTILYPLCEMHIHAQKFYQWYLPLIVAAAAILLSVLIVTAGRICRKMTAGKHI